MTNHWRELRDLLLQASDDQLDGSMLPLIEQWGDAPTSVQVLEVLDYCAREALASDFTMQVLNIMLEIRLAQENKEMKDIIPLATWRNK